MTPSRKDKDSQSFASRRDKEREKAEKERAAAASVTERLKAVVRRLPPNLPEDVFWQSVLQWVSDETVTWKVFYPGKFKKKINKENLPSRAYIAFKNEELLAQFSKDYDGHVFRDKQGNESQAIVEFAPYQKIPSDKKKVDARNATIEKDEDYISFITSLNDAANAEPVSIETLIAANQAPPMPKTTPLLEALKAEKSASKDKEAILRNHAHYKDPVILASSNAMRGASSSAKDEVGKKKGGSSVHPKEAASESGKKGKKPQLSQTAAAKQQQAAAAMAKKEHAQSPKPSRAARQQAAAAKAAAAAIQPVTQPQAHASGDNKSADVPLVSISSSGESGENPAAATSAVAAQFTAAAASRRGRPIVGLGSRQLQAALSQVGAAAVERKKREREKEVVKEGTSADAAEGSSEMGKGLELGPNVALPASPEPPADAERSKSGTPSSPRRDRRKRERVGHQYEAGPKVPSIMQRPDGIPPLALQRDASGQVLPGPARGQATSTNDNVVPTGPSGGPPRGPRRGRGRGRGGPIHRGG